MARIPDEVIDRLKTEVALQRLVEAKGIELRRHGADLLGLCPFHDDREPSLVISPAKNLWHCMGACAAGGSVIDWVMRAEGISFRHAVELLRAGEPVSGRAGPPPGRTVRNLLPAAVSADAHDAELLDRVVGYYHETLRASTEAQAFLSSRGLGHAEMVETFRLGFANRTLGYRLPSKTTREGVEVRERLTRLGVIRSSGHEHFNGSLVVPIHGGAGTVVELYGRKITSNLRKGTPSHLFLPGPHAGVWNLPALAASPEVIVCEALLDAMSFWVAGFRHVTSAYGIEGFGNEHAGAMRTHGTRRVLIAFDHDPAGDRAADRLAERLNADLGVECFRVQFPAGADANDVLVADGPDGLARAVRRSAWLGKGPGPASYRSAEPLAHDRPAAAAPPAPDLPDAAAADADAVPSFAAEPTNPPPGPESFMDTAGLPASPVPPSPPGTPAPTVAGDELTVSFGDRRWRVRGLSRVTSFDLLRLNVLVARDDPRTGQVFHVDTLDLYSARSRSVFVKQAADELAIQEDTIKRDLGRVLLACESAAEEAVRSATEPQDSTVVLSAEEEAAALELLRDPRLVERILDGFTAAGVVGEETNKLVGYLAAVSRKLPDPLAVMVRSSSAAGKSSLLDAVVAFVPEEDRVAYSAMTGQSLFYMGERDLAHKVLAIAEEEGAARASYALKLLQSEGELSIASTGKDPATGRLTTHTYRVVGPVAILTTTTAAEVDEELLNRCIVLTVDEDRAQTRAIHDRQRAAQTIDGLLARRERDAVLALHRNAQRLLKPMVVANPFAPRLGFADERTRTRRDHMKYLALIRAIALLHQHQRPRRSVTHSGREVAYIEASVADVALANRLAAEVLGRSLDELAPQSRRLLEVLDDLVAAIAKDQAMERAEVRFSRRDLRERCAWGDTQLKVHLARLVELELVIVHKGGRGQSFVYELAWDGSGRDGRPFLTGLIDPATLAPDPDPAPAPAAAYDPDRSGSNRTRSGVGRGPVGPRSGGGRNGAVGMNGQASGHIEANGGGEGEERTSADDTSPAVIGEHRPAAARAS